jgi:hypothetical protein
MCCLGSIIDAGSPSVCVCVCVCVFVCVCKIYTYIHIYVCTYICTYISVPGGHHRRKWSQSYTAFLNPNNIHVDMYVCVCVCIHIHKYAWGALSTQLVPMIYSFSRPKNCSTLRKACIWQPTPQTTNLFRV